MSHQINIGFETQVEDEQAIGELIRTCALRVLESENVPFEAEIDVDRCGCRCHSAAQR